MGRTIGSRTTALLLCGAMAGLLGGCPPAANQARQDQLNDIAQTWMRLAIDGTRSPGKGPTVESRKLFQVAATMYEAWAAYDPTASGYFTGNSLKAEAPSPTLDNTVETLSHAVYIVLRDGFKFLATQPAGSAPRAAYDAMQNEMIALGYLDSSGKVIESQAQALGKKIGDDVVDFCRGDGANEANGYADTTSYVSANVPLELDLSNADLADVNRWQPIRLPNGTLQSFLTPQWGGCVPFSLSKYNPNELRIDPGEPPAYGTDTQAQFVNEFVELVQINAALDPTRGPGTADFNMSPRVRGNNTFPSDTDGKGHLVNPYTNQPYADDIMKLGDYYRCQASFLDGNHFSMPASWWFQIATDILSGSGVALQRPTNKTHAHDLEYDVKLLFALGGAEHDTGIAVWDVKNHYDWTRPVEAIRWLGGNDLLPLQPGLIEIIGEDDPLAGPNGENVGHQKVYGWLGAYEGVGWMLPEEWLPYQAPNFITPPFPGYTSGHSAYGEAMAVVLAAYTGDEFVPGGLLEFDVTELPWDSAPLQKIRLQWATYRDVADDAGLARKFCGVHPANDNLKSRAIGKECGDGAVALASRYFAGLAHGILAP